MGVASSLHQAPVPLTPRRRALVTAGVLTGMFVAALEATIITTAMPTVVQQMGGLDRYSLAFTTYLITSTVTMPLWGKLSDLYGRRPVYLVGLIIFLLGCALCGASQSMNQLIAFRAVQGIGAGTLLPLAMTIIADIYSITERARMQAVFSSVWGIASIVGPLLGGFITDYFSWRGVFFLFLPVGAISGAIVQYGLREPPRHDQVKLDWPGAILLTGALGILMWALTGNRESAAWGPARLALLVAGVLLLGWWVWLERHKEAPLLPLDLLRRPVISIPCVVVMLASMAMFGTTTFVPLLARSTRGATASEAGSLLTPFMLSWVVASIFAGRLMLSHGARPVSAGGCLSIVAGLLLVSSTRPEAPGWWLYSGMAAIGTGMGMVMLPLLLAMQSSVEPRQLGVATSLNMFSRSLGGAIGGAALGLMLSTRLAAALSASGASHATGLAVQPETLLSAAARARLTPAVLNTLRDAMDSALRGVFLAAAAAALVALLVSLLIPAGLARTRPLPAANRDFVTADSEAEEKK